MYIYKYVVANNCCMSDTSTAIINYIIYAAIFIIYVCLVML